MAIIGSHNTTKLHTTNIHTLRHQSAVKSSIQCHHSLTAMLAGMPLLQLLWGDFGVIQPALATYRSNYCEKWQPYSVRCQIYDNLKTLRLT